jgi:hypothetical protein
MIDRITEQPFCQTRVSGSIIINKGRNDNYRQFKSNSDWFNNAEYFTLIENGNCLTIKKHYIQVPKNAQKTKTGHFMCISELPIGKFEFDEDESSEDVVVVYCH